MSTSSLENRVSSRPAREVRPRLTSPSTFVVVVSAEAVSFRYVDGKTLMGMGTRASKSSLTGWGRLTLESLSRKVDECKTEGFGASQEKGRGGTA